ncbi:ribose-phosphate pyrophosphokinase [candidate division KSB1 bacterium]|nr:ribose-phosphate pyrophosphokinase [candidate division KSB1 bacterium]
MKRKLLIFSGRANKRLAQAIAKSTQRKLGDIQIENFSDGEIWIKYNENIRGTDVFLIQPTNSPSENLLELLIMIDAARRASASRITAVIPYFGYARQDRKDQPRVSIGAKLVANLITKAGANRVLTMDLHAPQIQGFFDIPLDHLYAASILIDHLKTNEKIKNLVVVSPDVGSISLAKAYARRLSCELAILNKRRPRPNKCQVTELIGRVDGKNALLVDDLVDTAGTLIEGIAALKTQGAKDIYVSCTHAILSGPAIERIQNSKIKKFFLTDTVYIPEKKLLDNMHILSVANQFGEAIKRIHLERSISDLFPVKEPTS